MPSPLVSPEMNIRSPRYYIARTVSTCWHCGSPTALVAIAVPPGHETLDVDDDASDDASDEGSDDETQHREHPAAAWSVADHNAFLFYIDSLPGAVQKRIVQVRARPVERVVDVGKPAHILFGQSEVVVPDEMIPGRREVLAEERLAGMLELKTAAEASLKSRR